MENNRIPNIVSGKFWAYFSPENYIQFRTLAETKEGAMRCLSIMPERVQEYEEEGFYLAQVECRITPIKRMV